MIDFIDTRKSPNYSSRNDVKIDTVIVHHTASLMPDPLNWLCDPQSQVSAHLLVTINGQIYSLVDLEDKAWHAGRSQYDYDGDGKIYSTEYGLNARSIGIEIESLGDAYTDQQMGALVMLCLKFMHVYQVQAKHILGHKEVSLIGKIDPGNFDMQKFRVAMDLMYNVRAKVIV